MRVRLSGSLFGFLWLPLRLLDFRFLLGFLSAPSWSSFGSLPGQPPFPGLLLFLRPPWVDRLHRIHASRRTCMNAQTAIHILIESVRAVSRSLRGLADTLDLAASRAEGTPGPSGPTPSISSDTVDTVDWDLITHLDAASGHQVTSRGPLGSPYSAYHEVASSIPPLPAHCIDLCSRLAGTAAEVQNRAQRAWEAGCWAKATWEGKVPKPRPTPKLGLQSTVYIILKGPGISRPVRVSSAAEYYKLLPKFEDSISHAFASQAEGKVYCLGVRPGLVSRILLTLLRLRTSSSWTRACTCFRCSPGSF